MKKIVTFIAICFFIPSISMAAVTLGDGTSIGDDGNNPTAALSLSPGVLLSYDSASDDTYALTGANQKGNMCYAVEAGDQGVYQKEVGVGETNLEAANDATVYSESTEWVGVGQ